MAITVAHILSVQCHKLRFFLEKLFVDITKRFLVLRHGLLWLARHLESLSIRRPPHHSVSLG
jgi:hypothetical protein